MGEVFAGRYELLDPIAMGGMGAVWCVLDRNDNELKAAKILRQSDAASLLRFVREQSMRIDHLHVVTPQSWAGMDDRVLFTMPLVRGGSVSGLLKQHGALPVRWTALLVDQTLHALEAVHAAEIVHRDVKPANLLLEPTGLGRPHLRLTDFGIAAPLDEPRMTRASMVIGSPGYMAPEQWRGADPDFRSDLYSVARVGIEMLTGERPSSDAPGIDASALHTGDAHRDALVDLLARAAAPEPADRPATATQMRAELAALELTDLPPDPEESIEITDQFAGLRADAFAGPEEPTRVTDAGGPATQVQTREGTAAATRGTHLLPPGQHPLQHSTTGGRSSTRQGIALLAVGIVCLVAALLLVL